MVDFDPQEDGFPEEDPGSGANPGPEASGATQPSRGLEEGDLALIDDMLSRSPEERLDALEQTVRSLEALLAATSSAIPAE